MRSLLRVKQYHDTIERQAADLAGWNRELEERVAAQVEEIERVGGSAASCRHSSPS